MLFFLRACLGILSKCIRTIYMIYTLWVCYFDIKKRSNNTWEHFHFELSSLNRARVGDCRWLRCLWGTSRSRLRRFFVLRSDFCGARKNDFGLTGKNAFCDFVLFKSFKLGKKSLFRCFRSFTQHPDYYFIRWHKCEAKSKFVVLF